MRFQPTKCASKALGFTLIEALIALAIIGILMALLLPMINKTREEQTRQTVFRETITTLAQIQTEGIENDTMIPANIGSYFIQRLNAARVCSTDSSTQGCWDTTLQGSSPIANEELQAGVIMHNGVAIVGFDDGAACQGIYIDWNGKKPPNTEGKDQMQVIISLNPPGCSFPGLTIKYADMAAYSGTGESSALWDEIFDP